MCSGFNWGVQGLRLWVSGSGFRVLAEKGGAFFCDLDYLSLKKSLRMRFLSILCLSSLIGCIGFDWGHHFVFTNELGVPVDSLRIVIGEHENWVMGDDSSFSYEENLTLPKKGKKSPVKIIAYSGRSVIHLDADSFGAFNADGSHEYVLKQPRAAYIFHH